MEWYVIVANILGAIGMFIITFSAIFKRQKITLSFQSVAHLILVVSDIFVKAFSALSQEALCVVRDVLVVTTSGADTITMDKTWQEIYDAFPNVIVAKSNQYYVGKGLIEVVYHEEMGDYGVVDGSNTYTTYSSSGYPQYNNIV